MKIVLTILIGMFLFSAPFVSSHIETNNYLHLSIVCGSNKNGYIDIDRGNQKVKYYFPYRFGKGGKGMTDLSNVVFSYRKETLIMVYKTTSETIFKIRCNRDEFEVINSFLKTINKQIIDSKPTE
ncbi:hypothetical protein [Mediterranea massiliensis]|uniref:hypothetical protein n=1 Tax=Mediterranea massiliensis TaxID=1841865 RepID=UPI000934FD1D|nr:hypothetical protein [Mediterranea massiliensis]